MKNRILALVMSGVIAWSAAGCNVLGNYIDVTVYPGATSEDPAYAIIFNKWNSTGTNAESDTDQAKALKIIIEDIDLHCGPSGTVAQGSWGVHDTDRTSGFTATGYERRSTTYPDSTMVACAADEFDDSLICDLGGVSAQDEMGNGSDCQDEEDNYLINEPATQLYHDMMTDVASVDEVADFLANVYDTYYGTYVYWPSVSNPYRPAQCVIGKTAADQAYPLDGTSTSVVSWVCA